MTGIPIASTGGRGAHGALALLGVVGAGVAAAVIVAEPTFGWAGVVVAGVFGASIAIGGALFAAIHAAIGARWWHPLRGVAVGLTAALPAPAVALALAFGVGLAAVYPWADPAVVAHDHLVQLKTGWLDRPFFLARAAVILLVWFAFGSALRRRVRDGQPLAHLGIGFLIAFGLTISVAYWDWTMSLEPQWYSTMHGVYGFAGTLQAGIAAVALWTLRLRARGALGDDVTPRHLHDLGKLLFAFSFFWGYIWFCQAMLIWYANIPEETIHFAHRLSGGWSMLFWLNPVLNLVIPFVALLSARAKRSPAALGQVALIVLAGHWLDTLLLVGPAVSPAASALPYAAIGATVAVGAGMLYALGRVRAAA